VSVTERLPYSGLLGNKGASKVSEKLSSTFKKTTLTGSKIAIVLGALGFKSYLIQCSSNL